MVSYSATCARAGERAAPWLRAAALLTVVGFSAPFAYLVLRAAAEPESLWQVLTSRRALVPLLGSVGLAATVSVGATVVGTGAAWLTARTDVPGRSLWRVLLPLPLVFPSFIGAMVLLAAFAPGGLLETVLGPLGVGRLPRVDGFWGSFIVLTLFTYPYVYMPVASRLRQLPGSIEESARLLGRGPRATFVAVVIPQASPALAAGGLLVFLYVVSDFGVVQMMRFDTLTRLIYATRLLDRPTSIAASLLLGVVALATIAAERALARRALVHADRATRPLTVALKRSRVPSAVALGGLVALALGVPVAVMTWWAARGLLRDPSAVARAGAQFADLLPATVNSAGVAIVAALATVSIVLPSAYLGFHRPGRLAAAANAVVVAGFALPGLAIALALASFTLDAPAPLSGLYGSLPLLVAAYVVHFGAQGMRTAQVAVASVPSHVSDAGRVLGASRLRRLVALEAPLMMPGLLAGAGLVLLSTMKELPATLLLAPIGFDTLAVKIWSASEGALFAQASVGGLMLVAVSGLLTWVLVIKRAEAFL